MTAGVRVAVVGATGAVGEELRRQLDERAFPVDGEPVYVASERSAGLMLPWRDREVRVQPLSPEAFDGVQIALFSAGAAVSTEWAPIAVERGATVVDNSSAFRTDPEVPLVVAEVNPDDLDRRPKGIVANPNCTTMVLMVAAKPLHDAFGLREMVVTSFQATGGKGLKGIAELIEQAAKLVHDPDALRRDGAGAAASVDPQEFAKAIAFNVLPYCGDLAADAYTGEEWKLVNESRRILAIPHLQVAPTCVRVPVVVGHAVSARLTFDATVTTEAALEVLAAAPGLVVSDDVEDGSFAPTPLDAAGRDEVLVGRVRRDLFDTRSLNLWAVGDNLLKGAALNAVQLAELLVGEAGFSRASWAATGR